MIVNAFNPWLSCADLDKGSIWATELAKALATAKAGIVCLTPNNLTAPYVLFEAGAISKTVEKPYVCTLLIGMAPSDITGPLAQFQATTLAEQDLLQLVKTLNSALGESALKEAQVEATFKLCLPKLQERLNSLPPDGPTTRPTRSEREILEEILGWVRNQDRRLRTQMDEQARTVAEENSRLMAKLAAIGDANRSLEEEVKLMTAFAIAGKSSSEGPTMTKANEDFYRKLLETAMAERKAEKA